MINDDLFAKFDSIDDLPISEELLGAYTEGNLRGAEYREVHNIVSNDTNLSDLMSSVEQDSFFNEIDRFNHFDNAIGVTNADDYLRIDIEELELPSISTELLIGATPLSSDIVLDATFDDVIGQSHDDISNQDVDCNSNNNDLFHNNGISDNMDI
ncbi:MAG: hypothetical protein NC115_01410 [Bacteroidales bacterium]|nr:hypothetical protein [Bacteroidales bacterium]